MKAHSRSIYRGVFPFYIAKGAYPKIHLRVNFVTCTWLHWRTSYSCSCVAIIVSDFNSDKECVWERKTEKDCWPLRYWRPQPDLLYKGEFVYNNILLLTAVLTSKAIRCRTDLLPAGKTPTEPGKQRVQYMLAKVPLDLGRAFPYTQTMPGYAAAYGTASDLQLMPI